MYPSKYEKLIYFRGIFVYPRRKTDYFIKGIGPMYSVYINKIKLDS